MSSASVASSVLRQNSTAVFRRTLRSSPHLGAAPLLPHHHRQRHFHLATRPTSTLNTTTTTPKTTFHTRSFHASSAKMVVKELKTMEQYQEAVKQSETNVVVFDFYATWCGPCKLVAPQVEKMSESAEFKDVQFYKIDVDEVPDAAQANEIRAMPTFLVYHRGQKINEVVGANHKGLNTAITLAVQNA